MIGSGDGIFNPAESDVVRSIATSDGSKCSSVGLIVLISAGALRQYGGYV